MLVPFPSPPLIRIMAFTDAILAIICTSCAVPLWANGTRNFNPVRLMPFVTTFFILVRLWYVERDAKCKRCLPLPFSPHAPPPQPCACLSLLLVPYIIPIFPT